MRELSPEIGSVDSRRAGAVAGAVGSWQEEENLPERRKRRFNCRGRKCEDLIKKNKEKIEPPITPRTQRGFYRGEQREDFTVPSKAGPLTGESAEDTEPVGKIRKYSDQPAAEAVSMGIGLTPRHGSGCGTGTPE